MPEISVVEKLIKNNSKLQELAQYPPFQEFYPYYVLRNLLKTKLTDFLIDEVDYVASMKLFLQKGDVLAKKNFSPPYKPADFLHHISSSKGDSIDLLTRFFNNLISAPYTNADKSKIKNFDFGPIKTLTVTTGIGKKPDLSIGPGVVLGFFLKAEKCEKILSENGHTSLKYLDLFSIFCGFKDFTNFLNIHFGDHYQIKKDKVLQKLLRKSPYTTSQISKFNETKQLVSKTVFKPKILIGRDSELEKVFNLLNFHKKIAIVGEGGIGKTSLAATIYHQAFEKKLFSEIAWLFCKNGTISAFKEATLDFNLIGKDTLLVLDNVGNDLFEFLQESQGFEGYVLITSRNTFDWEGLAEFRLHELKPKDSKSLFKTHYSNRDGKTLESGDEFERLLDQLISAIGTNTLLIELFAKLLKKDFSDSLVYRYGIKEFLIDLRKNGLYLVSGNENLNTAYCFFLRKEKAASIQEILDSLYDFSNLTDFTRKLLVNLSLLPSQEYSFEDLMELFLPDTPLQFRRNLNMLFSQGWIGGDGENVFKVSPVVQEMTIRKNKKTLFEDSKKFIERVWSMIQFNPELDDIQNKYKWAHIALVLLQELEEEIPSNFSHFLIELGSLLKQIGGKNNLENGLRVLAEAISIDSQNYGPNNPKVVSTRLSIAETYRSLGGRRNLESALIHLGKALKSNQLNLGLDSTESFQCISKIVTVLSELELLQGSLDSIYQKQNLNEQVENLEIIEIESVELDSKTKNSLFEKSRKYPPGYGSTINQSVNSETFPNLNFSQLTLSESSDRENFLKLLTENLQKTLHLENLALSSSEDILDNLLFIQFLKKEWNLSIENLLNGTRKKSPFDLEFKAYLEDSKQHPDLRKIFSRQQQIQLHIKRFIDIVLVSVFFITIGWWIIPLICFCIYIESKAPIFFKTRMKGVKNSIFIYYKFNILNQNHSKQNNEYELYSKVGFFLKRTGLDQLPLLYSVLVGDMSLVGPILLNLHTFGWLITVPETNFCRYLMKPGIIGLAQSKGLNEPFTTNLDHHFLKKTEFFYVKNWSLALDFLILFRTVKSIFKHKSAY